jgi:hypothetical protein
MKKLFYLLFFFLPIGLSAQFNLNESSLLDSIWKNVGNAGFSVDRAWYTSLAFSPSGEPYVAYGDDGNIDDVTVMRFNGNNWVNVGNANFSGLMVDYTCLAFNPSDGSPYVAFASTNQYGAYVMKFDGTNWLDVGTLWNFQTSIALYTSLAFSPSDGQPYVAYSDYGNSSKATVMKFNGTNWVQVGAKGFTAGRADYTSLGFSPSGEPYIAYGGEYPDNTKKATVMKFDGTNWVNIGDTGFSAGEANYTSLAFSPSGEPYVAYEDYGNSRKATVMKFNGTNWENVGNAGFSAGVVNFTSLAFSLSGQPYVAFMDCADSSCKATVMKFDGTNWITVGTSGFSAGMVNFTSLAFSALGEPYVAYMDWGNSAKATVMKYDSVLTGISEPQHTKTAVYPNPAADKITIETSVVSKESNLVIVNIAGRELITRQVSELKTVIDISSLPSGVYFVRLTNDRTVEVGKFVKQ